MTRGDRGRPAHRRPPHRVQRKIVVSEAAKAIGRRRIGEGTVGIHVRFHRGDAAASALQVPEELLLILEVALALKPAAACRAVLVAVLPRRHLEHFVVVSGVRIVRGGRTPRCSRCFRHALLRTLDVRHVAVPYGGEPGVLRVPREGERGVVGRDLHRLHALRDAVERRAPHAVNHGAVGTRNTLGGRRAAAALCGSQKRRRRRSKAQVAAHQGKTLSPAAQHQ
mmetsp:Transcript_24154/g.74774  ORF Transcript_24154/g.74774 Transcript_24154/m.74774 type:complete len:224 (-) Transcript_24154:18-689(-)